MSLASSGRIGVITNAGEAVVKDGGIYGTWVDEMPGVQTLRLSGSWIGVVTTAGDAVIKDGNLFSPWSPTEMGNVNDLQLDNAAGRIAVLTTAGEAVVKDGGIYGTWVDEMPGVAQIGLTSF
jgi:hypothetical protein